MPTKNTLLDFRNEINKIDEKIVKLLSKRKTLVSKIAESKIHNNQKIRDIDREKKILKKLMILAEQENLSPKYIAQLFQLIIKNSVSVQNEILKNFYNLISSDNMKIFAFLGPKGSYSHFASEKYAKKKYKKFSLKECSSFEEVISEVEKNKADYAVLPIENTCSGLINEVYELLKKTNLIIVKEISISIDHCLIAIEKINLNKIKKIYSHPQPFKQCSNFIKKFSHCTIRYTKSTTDAIKKIIDYNNASNVALGSEQGAKMYKLHILMKNITNQENNITKFIILKK